MQTSRAFLGTTTDLIRSSRGKLPEHPIDAFPGPRFREAITSKDSDGMLHWIRTTTQSGIGPLVRFAYGLRKDFKAVISAVETSWSNGQTEGQINRLKAIKRQMYGRAGFHLLRARVLPYRAMAP